MRSIKLSIDILRSKNLLKEDDRLQGQYIEHAAHVLKAKPKVL